MKINNFSFKKNFYIIKSLESLQGFFVFGFFKA